ncbi:acyl-CoA dehydrogenase family protein [Paeniglutamicibacter cryotolerans]|uniref:Alkylation response protein AidB-like acyl-CoA dehydrogenase n=1 Tax=Paeniglutamicibacter cryotolerans TaxID=670079 RepID=A0A839QJ35_9MICC|nr:acyl-CoA dehydrogenase family protein [Paeniglutamicibacter cryotolerans]MBB2995850.1 alkylation response protein AidB-like acyl-CoA dehydrogenase [Paeniglutamicibacter cryotolerans]
MSTVATTRHAAGIGTIGTEEPDYAGLAARFRPFFTSIAAGSAQRDSLQQLPYEQVRALADAGFGALRVPVADGGFGATLPQFFELLTELAAADSSIAQALRAHFAFVEDRLLATEGRDRDTWLARFVAGELVGNAWTEIGAVKVGDVLTKVSPAGDGTFRINGEKFYSTGSIFADWLDTYAERTDTGARVIAAVRADQPGIERRDDWDGFGQRTTGTGTSTFTHAVVQAEELIDFDARFKYQTAFYQNVLLAVLAGSVRGAEREFALEVRNRKRTFSHAAASIWREDPQILQVIGELSAAGFTGEAVVRRVAQALQGAHDAALALRAGDIGLVAEEAANDAAELAAAAGQVALTPLAVNALSHAFDALAASATSTAKNLDRHWRNARTAGNHNPWVYKARLIGDLSVNDVALPRVWAIGAA